MMKMMSVLVMFTGALCVCGEETPESLWPEPTANLNLKSKAESAEPEEVKRAVQLAVGLYELTADAAGRGRLLLAVGESEREMPLSRKGGPYGLLVKWPGGPAECRVGVLGEANIKAIQLLPASEAQHKAWKRREHDLVTFGFETISPQRPLPDEPARAVVDAKGLNGMTDKAVFFDERIQFNKNVHMDRPIRWLERNGFSILNAEALWVWMRQEIEDGAYGSVVVMPMGMAPASINDAKGKRATWYRYMQSGGRVVWIGDPPFYYFIPVRAEPAKSAEPALSTMGLNWGWAQPFWGFHPPVALTEQGKAWGMEGHGQSMTGFNAKEVSLTLAEYKTKDGQRGAASWLLNFRPDMPWSGLVMYSQWMNGTHDAQLRDVWRLAHYVGKKIESFPRLPLARSNRQPALRVMTGASGLQGRTQFARGETVSVFIQPGAVKDFDKATVYLLQDERVLASAEGGQEKMNFFAAFIQTEPYAYGDYMLRVEVSRENRPLAFQDIEIGIRYVRPVEFGWEMWAGVPENDHQARLIMEDIQRAGMDTYIGQEVRVMDWYLRYGRRFSERVHASGTRGVKPETHPHRYIKGPDGKLRRWGRGQFMHGISHEENMSAGREEMLEGIRKAAAHPAFNGIVLTNDDYSSLHYGFDYGDHNLARFKKLTGLDVPKERPKLKYGVVPDNDPWLQWCLFTLKQVSGRWNQMQKEAVTSLRKDIRIGPIPGGMQIPMIHMWSAGQYPPLNFGEWGHNLVACYYYNSYWQPLTTNTCWIECGRMGNRSLPTWLMPDAMRPLVNYTRNNLFHLLAAGVRGLTYFTYKARTREAWDELVRLRPVIERIAPVQARIEPKGRRIALMYSVTTDCYKPADCWLLLPYAYANLLQAHYDVDIIAEEEVVDGICKNYDAVLLYRSLYLRKSVSDALYMHAKNGGTVLLDRTVPFNIPGAKRVNVDWAMGGLATKDIPPLGAHVATPGPKDYGHPERIAAVKEALQPFIEPPFKCDDDTLVAHPFRYRGVNYVWFVNALSGEEYRLCQDRLLMKRTEAAKQEIHEWEEKELREHPTFETAVTYAKLPGVPYDLTQGRPLTATKVNGGERLPLSMDRFGGSLIAFYPEPIESIKMDVPRQAKAGVLFPARITVSGKTGPINGVVPVKFTLTDPAGKVSVLSRTIGAVGGRCQFDWKPAVNDTPGKWAVSAIEQASGKKASVSITLSP